MVLGATFGSSLPWNPCVDFPKTPLKAPGTLTKERTPQCFRKLSVEDLKKEVKRDGLFVWNGDDDDDDDDDVIMQLPLSS